MARAIKLSFNKRLKNGTRLTANEHKELLHVTGDATQHGCKPGLKEMFIPADLRAIGITSMDEFVNLS